MVHGVNSEGLPLIPIWVEWHDAHVGSDGWEAREDLEDDGPALVHTCGYLLTTPQGGKENHISVVTTWSADDMVHCVFHIPVQMVQRVEVLVRSHELAEFVAFPKASGAFGS
jgi:hypothetical protein